MKTNKKELLERGRKLKAMLDKVDEFLTIVEESKRKSHLTTLKLNVETCKELERFMYSRGIVNKITIKTAVGFHNIPSILVYNWLDIVVEPTLKEYEYEIC